MEFVNGGTLYDLMKLRLFRPCTLVEVQMITKKLQEVLESFKKQGVIHRDLHMGQVMLRFRALEHIKPYPDQKAAVKSKLLCELRSFDFEIVVLDYGRAKEVK